MPKQDIIYGEQKAVLSRIYPFGNIVEIEVGRDEDDKPIVEKRTQLIIQEPTANDEIVTDKIARDKNTNVNFELLAIVSGCLYSDILKLARKDVQLVTEIIQNF